MNQHVDQPDWIKGYVPPPDKHWQFKPGRSGNPTGRPKGSAASKKEKMARLLDDDGVAVVRVVLDAALEGDMTAASLVLSRLVPPYKAQGEKVEFTFDPDLPLSGQLAQVAVAVASGQVPPDVGTQISAMLSNLANVRASENLEQRIIALEAKAINS